MDFSYSEIICPLKLINYASKDIYPNGTKFHIFKKAAMPLKKKKVGKSAVFF